MGLRTIVNDFATTNRSHSASAQSGDKIILGQNGKQTLKRG